MNKKKACKRRDPYYWDKLLLEKYYDLEIRGKKNSIRAKILKMIVNKMGYDLEA